MLAPMSTVVVAAVAVATAARTLVVTAAAVAAVTVLRVLTDETGIYTTLPSLQGVPVLPAVETTAEGSCLPIPRVTFQRTAAVSAKNEESFDVAADGG